MSKAQKAEFKDIVTDIALKVKEIYADLETPYDEVANLIRQETIPNETVDLLISKKFG